MASNANPSSDAADVDMDSRSQPVSDGLRPTTSGAEPSGAVRVRKWSVEGDSLVIRLTRPASDALTFDAAMTAFVDALDGRLPREEAKALAYAKSLAAYTAEKYRNSAFGLSPNWAPFGDLTGVLTQLDNMLSGMTVTATPESLAVASREAESSPPSSEGASSRAEQSPLEAVICAAEEVVLHYWKPGYEMPDFHPLRVLAAAIALARGEKEDG